MLKLRSILLNSKAAIDLASIMVGIIVIGLIGGVIAATVFAVIPWAQDNAAKNQLQSIHTAQNAAFGLSSDPSRDLPPGQERNSFSDSTGLAAAGLLSLSQAPATYCTVDFIDDKGDKNYIAWAKSGSGKVFYSTNNDKIAKSDSTLTSLPCVIQTPITIETPSPEPTIPPIREEVPVGGYNPVVAEPGETEPRPEGTPAPVIISPTPTNPSTPNPGNPTQPQPSGPALPESVSKFPTGEVGTVYSHSVAGTGNPAPTYSISPALPAGLSLNSTTGVISGTPQVQMSQTTFTVTATNNQGSTTSEGKLTINPYPRTILYSNTFESNQQNNNVATMSYKNSINQNYNPVIKPSSTNSNALILPNQAKDKAPAIIKFNIGNLQPGTYEFSTVPSHIKNGTAKFYSQLFTSGTSNVKKEITGVVASSVTKINFTVPQGQSSHEVAIEISTESSARDAFVDDVTVTRIG